MLQNFHIWIIKHESYHQNHEKRSQETFLQNTIIIMHIRQKQTTPHEKIIIMYVLTIGITQ